MLSLRLRQLVFLLLLVLQGSRHVGAQSAPEGWDTAMGLPVAADLNPDPNILEINLTAQVAKVEVAPGKVVDAWTYNGSLPGPLIHLKVGDRLIVHFTNRLPSPTTVHWHGLQVPIEMDGVPGASQPPVLPGASFTYNFIVPDAGLFWYHPHVMSAEQVGFGLYGAFLVDDPTQQFGIEEHVLVLSDIDLLDDGKLAPSDTGGSAGMAFGREGNVLLVNGRNHPTVRVKAGVPQRWRVVNTAKSRYYDLSIDSPFTLIGVDGGIQEYSQELKSLVLGPGQRADVFLTPGAKPGARLPVAARLFDRGYGSVETRLGEDLFTMVMDDTAPPASVALPKVSRTIAPLNQAGATPVSLEFGVFQNSASGLLLYTINGKTLADIPQIKATVGETQIWTVTNNTPWTHPLHLHGFFFQVLDKTTGQPVHPVQWRDTVSVPYKDSLKLIVRFDDRPGSWMYHCHILDHAEGGLMSSILLTRPGEAAPPSPAHEHTHNAGPQEP